MHRASGLVQISIAFIVVSCVSALLTARGLNAESFDEQHLMDKAVMRLKEIKDIAQLSSTDRMSCLKAVEAAFPPSERLLDLSLENYARGVLKCAQWFSSSDFGDRELQEALSQRMVMYCLSFADSLTLESEADLVEQLRTNRDAAGKVQSGTTWPELRNKLMEHRLHLWRRIDRKIDDGWNPKDRPFANISPPGGGYPSGIAPEDIKDLDIRRKYENDLKNNTAMQEP